MKNFLRVIYKPSINNAQWGYAVEGVSCYLLIYKLEENFYVDHAYIWYKGINGNATESLKISGTGKKLRTNTACVGQSGE